MKKIFETNEAASFLKTEFLSFYFSLTCLLSANTATGEMAGTLMKLCVPKCRYFSFRNCICCWTTTIFFLTDTYRFLSVLLTVRFIQVQMIF